MKHNGKASERKYCLAGLVDLREEWVGKVSLPSVKAHVQAHYFMEATEFWLRSKPDQVFSTHCRISYDGLWSAQEVGRDESNE